MLLEINQNRRKVNKLIKKRLQKLMESIAKEKAEETTCPVCYAKGPHWVLTFFVLKTTLIILTFCGTDLKLEKTMHLLHLDLNKGKDSARRREERI